MKGIYKDKECKIIGKNFYHYLISYLEKGRKIKKIVSKKEVSVIK